ncbi:MAG: hypothetical protein JJE21_08730 [Spirochaetaceae bacterium]|nr:hypothetical protein [Spirochaetaceae bacterium]
MPLAVVEAKDNNKASGVGLEQAERYGKILDIPYVYSFNGDGFVKQNLITGLIFLLLKLFIRGI